MATRNPLYLTSIAVVLACFVFSCNNPSGQPPAETIYKLTDDSIATKLDTSTMLVVSSPIVFDSSGDVIFTLNYQKEYVSSRSLWSKIGSSSSYDSEGYSPSNFCNVIFHNTKTGIASLLTKENISISKMDYVYNYGMEDVVDERPRYILYTIYREDKRIDSQTKKEEAINGRSVLYISGFKGENFEPVSVLNEDVWDWTLVEGNRKIMVRSVVDVNKDSKFDSKDKLNVRVVDLAYPSGGDQALPSSFIKKLYQLEPQF